MKKIILVLFVGGLVILLQNISPLLISLREEKQTVKSPSGDKTGEIIEQEGTSSPKPGVNKTEFPLKIPDGFSISIFAKNLGAPRALIRDPHGNLLVSIPSQGKVSALTDDNKDGISDDRIDVISGLNRPHGLAFHEDKIYIAEMNQVAVYDYDPSILKARNKQTIVELPSGGNHTTRTIGFGPDGKLYISIGSSCNVCSEQDERRAKILMLDNESGDLKEYASGLRNSVFFTWHPVTREMWATEMGRDLIGDDIPPDEINIIRVDRFYGWPYCYGKNVHDRDFDNSNTAREKCASADPSYIDISAHSAPLGLAFVPGDGAWPKEYWHNLFVAYHGSWNRSEPTGYKVVRYRLNEKRNILGQVDFISGWRQGDDVIGRPVDILIDPSGVMYISDDKAGVIYKISAIQ